MPSLEKIEQLLRTQPDDLFLNFGKAMELTRLGRNDEAFTQFDRVLALDQSYCPAYFQKGRALLALQRFDEARVALQKGIRAAEMAGDEHTKGEIAELLASF